MFASFFLAGGKTTMASKRSCTLSIRFRPREIERLKQAAIAQDLTVTELIRGSLWSLMLKDMMAVELPPAKQPVEARHA
jgi:hypothetical protein